HQRPISSRHQRQVTNTASRNYQREVISRLHPYHPWPIILPTKSYSCASVISTLTISPAAGTKSSGTSLISTQPSMSGACVSILPCHNSSLSLDSPSNNTWTTSPTRALFLRREIFACSFIKLFRRRAAVRDGTLSGKLKAGVPSSSE